MTTKKNKAAATQSRKTKQRGNGRGTVYKYRGRFRWQYREEVNGTTRTLASGITDTKGEADKALAKVITDKERGLLVVNSKITLGEWLEKWLALRKSHVQATTFEQYEFRMQRYVPVDLKVLPLQEVRRAHILALEAKLAKQLAASSRKKVFEHLAAAFKEAMHQDLLIRNPADDIFVKRTPSELSKPQRRKALTDEELRRFFALAREDALYPVFYLMFSLGVRCGEALGLRWQDVDFEKRTVRIEQANKLLRNKPTLGDPKTLGSRRVLPASDDLLDVLAFHRAEQAKQRRAVGAWLHPELVFTTAKGTLLDRHNVHRTIQRLCRKAGIENFGTHAGRYTNLTNRLRAGQLPEVVSKIAGHSRVSTTMNIYRQVMPDEVRAAEFDLGAHLAAARRRLPGALEEGLVASREAAD